MPLFKVYWLFQLLKLISTCYYSLLFAVCWELREIKGAADEELGECMACADMILCLIIVIMDEAMSSSTPET